MRCTYCTTGGNYSPDARGVTGTTRVNIDQVYHDPGSDDLGYAALLPVLAGVAREVMICEGFDEEVEHLI